MHILTIHSTTDSLGATQTAPTPIVGSSGSSLLHFTEADEHVNVVCTLLHRPVPIESINMG